MNEIKAIRDVEDEPSCSGDQIGYDVLGNRESARSNDSRGAKFCYALAELNKTAKTPKARDNFLYYTVKTRYKHNGGYVLSPGPAVPRGEHFDENPTGER